MIGIKTNIVTQGGFYMVQVALSVREKQVLKLKMDGLCDKEIAKVLSLSYSTVRNYIDRAKLRMGCRSTYQLLVLASSQLY